MTLAVPSLPETAPFSAAQRAWLDGWVAAYYGAASAAGAAAPSPVAEEYPWHDMTLPLDERLVLAQGRKLPQVLMAAMAQQDCGQCGYLCDSYAAAIAAGSEPSLSRCVPGGRATARALKELLETVPLAPAPATAAAPAAAIAAPAGPGAVAAARLAAALPLNRAGSQKDTRHVVFDLAGSGLSYRVGDAFGVWPENCPEVVAGIIACLRARPDAPVTCPDGSERPLAEALARACEINRVADEAIEVLASRAGDLAESNRLQALAEGYPGAEPDEADLLELLETFRSARPPLQELISALSPLQPRLYSIASSQKAVGDAVNLTVGAVRYTRRGRQRRGVASTFLADRVVAGAAVPVFIQPAAEFHLPDDPDAPVIMIGPGTGVAPFRAFLQERRACGARGRNWLFFGDQHRASDFLYEDEITGLHRDGLLSELDLAFSRDQPERIYVQQRMRERAALLWAWLEEGAHLYVCGAAAMARDVDAGLAAIISRQAGIGSGAAKAYLAKLARDKRYLRDVY